MLQRFVRHSGLQKEILRLYKELLRTAQKKELPRSSIENIRQRFRQRAEWPHRDIETIEAWLRQGRSQLEILQRPETKNVTVFRVPVSK